MRKETDSSPNVFAQKIRALEQRSRDLKQQAAQGWGEQGDLLLEVVTELQVSLEELRVAEEELRQQTEELVGMRQIVETERQRYRDLFEFAPDGYLVTDAKGTVKEANRAVAKLLGVSQRALIGKPLIIYLPQENHMSFYNLLQRIHQGESVRDWETSLLPRNRKLLPVSVNAVLKQNPHENITDIRWLLHENTSQVETREQLRKLNAELEERVEQRTAELQRSNDQLQQFAYVASHDLQEPLRAVSTYVQILADRYRSRLDSQADEFIHYAVDGANRMQELIRDLLDYSRVQTREQELIEINCDELVAGILENLHLSIADSMAAVTVDSLPVVLADRSQLRQVFQNLLINALKFCGSEPPQIRIAAQQQGQEWVFSVRDNGIGLDPRHAERIFVIFQRLYTRREYPGTGIGLAICKRIIERHGGRIWVESEPGKGATFYFTLPKRDN
jgi:PAS domain S-box-containing protein